MRINSLKDYKLTHISSKLDSSRQHGSTGTILATKRDVNKDATPIQTPTHLTDNIKAAIITTHDGTSIIAITAYMPRLHTKAQELIFLHILKWVKQDIITKYKDTTILMGGDLQATPAKKNVRSYYPPRTDSARPPGLHKSSPMTHTPSSQQKTHIDPWLLRQPLTTQH